MIKNCLQCNKELTSGQIKNGRANRGGCKYCSRTCFNLSKRCGLVKNCLRCNEEFKTIPAKIKRGWGKYCSTTCYIESQKTNKLGENNPKWRGGFPTCAVCGVKTKSYRRGEIRYCGDCYLEILSKGGENHPNWKGGISKTKEYKAHHDRIKRDKRRRNAVGSYTIAEWEAVKMKYRYMCLCCKRCEPEIVLTRDHVIPLSKGGLNDISNIQPLCHSCNSRKRTKEGDYRGLFGNYNYQKTEEFTTFLPSEGALQDAMVASVLPQRAVTI